MKVLTLIFIALMFIFIPHFVSFPAKGVANANSAGLISGLVQEASMLFPDLDETPIITLEGETRYLGPFFISLKNHYLFFINLL